MLVDTKVPVSVHVTSQIIESVYAKVETRTGVFECVKINLERGADKYGWWVVQGAVGEPWLCRREDMIKLFPLFTIR